MQRVSWLQLSLMEFSGGVGLVHSPSGLLCVVTRGGVKVI